jgi:hypothetical protein
MYDTAEIAALRTMLKNVNREYSATLRGQEGEQRKVTLEGLKRQRVALMSSIAELRGHRGTDAVTSCAPVGEPLVSEPLTEAAR